MGLLASNTVLLSGRNRVVSPSIDCRWVLTTLDPLAATPIVFRLESPINHLTSRARSTC